MAKVGKRTKSDWRIGAHPVNPGFQMHKRESAGNLHISILGEFNGMCAWELFKIIKRRGSSTGRVFVATTELGKILPDGVALFKSRMTQKPMPPDWLYFKGEKGFQIAPNGSRVLLLNPPGDRKGMYPKQVNRSSLPRSGRNRLKRIF